MAADMKQLRSFLHASTAYVSCQRLHLMCVAWVIRQA